jgi:hypothetical protein
MMNGTPHTTAAAADSTRGSRFASFRRVRALAAPLAAVALLAAPVSAHAQPPRPADPGVRCAAKIGPGEYEFYLPGAKVTDKDGNKWVCGPDGNWFRDYSAIRVTRYPVSQVLASSALAR